MQVQTVRAYAPQFGMVSQEPRADSKVAVLLNSNAKRVSARVHRAISHVVPEEDLFVSRTADEAQLIAEMVVERRYQTVFTGGGDGTFVGWVNEILNCLERKSPNGAYRVPRFGVLKLGTGNALAGMVGASDMRGDRMLDDILRARAGEVPSVRRIDLLVSEGKRAPFAGLGQDAAVLNDYNVLKSYFNDSRLKGLATGGPGFFLAMAGMTIPRFLVRKRSVGLQIVNLGGPAYRIGPDGRPVGGAIPKGELLYSGLARVASAATIPFYGFHFKMFPFAGKRRGQMHLRIADLPVPTILGNLPELWKGKFRHDRIFDFYADKVQLRFDQPMPFQMAGDAEGYRKEVTIGVASRSVELVDFASAIN